jgi:chromosome segregation ATPase
MTTLVAEVLDALRSINIPEDKARAAAAALSQTDDKFTKLDIRLAAIDTRFVELENRFTELENRLTELESRLNVRFSELEGRINTRFAELEGKLSKHDWALGLVITLNIAILLKLFWPH